MNMEKIKFLRALLCVVMLNLWSVAHANDFDIAHVREQGQDMIVFALDRSFGFKSQKEQHEIMYFLQRCVSGARLSGSVVVLWEVDGRTHSIGPKQWGDFLRSIDMMWHAQHVNKTLSCR